jgi:aspartate/methionine/tyrosine aminotransferase
MSGLSARARGLVCPPFDVLNQRAAALRGEGKNVISLGQAVPGFPAPPAAVEAARRALTDLDTHRYSADAGILSLREALCQSFKSHLRIDAAPDDVIVTAGGNQAFMLAAMVAADPGDEVVLAAPYFVNHEMAVRAAGAIPVEAAVDESAAFLPDGQTSSRISRAGRVQWSSARRASDRRRHRRRRAEKDCHRARVTTDCPRVR